MLTYSAFHTFCHGLSIIAFLGYGISCFVSGVIRLEFERYRLPKLRKLTGALEIAGALGLIVGFFYEPLRVLSAASLALLMVFGVLVRFRIGDNLFQMLPALILLVLNVLVSGSP